MNLLGVLLLVIFVAMTISTFYFWMKSQRIIRKYLSWRDIISVASAKEKIPADEWKKYKRYERYRLLCFVGGIILSLLLYILQWKFQLFIKQEDIKISVGLGCFSSDPFAKLY